MDLTLLAKLLGGIIGLAWGADRAVTAAVAILRYKRWSPALVGGVLLGVATTLPELIVSYMAVLHKNVGLSLGNAVGSYMANIGMVLGGVALIYPLHFKINLLKRDIPLMLVSVVLLTILLQDYFLGRFDALILLSGLLFLSIIIYASNKDDDYHIENITEKFRRSSIFFLVLGLFVLIVSADIIVNSASALARLYQVSDLTIGLTVVAVGTSLPEFITSLICAYRNEHAMAIGNVVGSNIFGILGVVAIPGLFAPGSVDAQIVIRDCTYMLGITFLLYSMVYFANKRDLVIGRLFGSCLVAVFLYYLYNIFY